MIKNVFIIYLLLYNTFEIKAQRSLADYVNPLIGTDSKFDISNGNTYPAVSFPWGMNCWSPETETLSKESFFPDSSKIPYWWRSEMKGGWFYTYGQMKLKGIKQTHQPSAWLTDYGAFSLFAETDSLKFEEDKRSSFFSHKTEIARPYYYSVYLADYDVTAEVSPTERAATFRFTFPSAKSSYILLDAFDKGSHVEVLPEKRKIIGYCKNNSGSVPGNFKNYFILYFDKDFDDAISWKDSLIKRSAKEVTGNHVMVAVKFHTSAGEIIHVKVASSFISYEQAELNLQTEIGRDDFKLVKLKAKREWDKMLGKIEIEGENDAQKTTFYTAMYRAMFFPRIFYEVNKEKKIVHYSPYNGAVLPGYMFTDVGSWDTFRGLFPFYTLLFTRHDEQIMEGLENAYKESGWIPEWASPGHRDCMIGSNSASIIADAYLKGIRGFDINLLYEGIIKNSNNEGPLMSMGRAGVSYYNTLGFVPYDVKVKENAARTLEYSYDDFCIMKLAQKLRRPKNEIDTFAKRAKYYQNVFDRTTHFMRGRNKDGSFQSPFIPEKWGDAFTEGNAWHYTWSVFHDPKGLIDLMGGRKNFIEKLDSLFIVPAAYDYSYYGYKIHEITEMQIYKMGQYAHGNEPLHHCIYLYDWAGEPWKTQYWVRLAMDRLYNDQPDGLCGDEDNGQMSVWYVLSAMGFYSVCPGSGQWAIVSPLFKKTHIHLENGKTFIINASHNNRDNVYILSAILNGKMFNRNYLNHADLINGGTFNLEMGAKPNKKRGNKAADLPYSLSDERKSE